MNPRRVLLTFLFIMVLLVAGWFVGEWVFSLEHDDQVIFLLLAILVGVWLK